MAQITLNSSGVASNGTLALQSNGTTTAVTIDASQNVGIGSAPSAWSGWNALQINGAMSLWSKTADLSYYSRNVYHDGTNRKYVFTGAAAEYVQGNGTHSWSYAASGTAGNVITFTTAMTLDASGNLGVGTSSPSSYSFDTGVDLVVGDGANSAISVLSSTTGTGYLAFADGTSGADKYRGLLEYSHTDNFLGFDQPTHPADPHHLATVGLGCRFTKNNL